MDQSPLLQELASCERIDIDIVIIAGCRTPITKSKRGGFKHLTADQLLSIVLHGLIDRSSVKKESVGDIIIGNVLQPGGGCAMARMVGFCNNAIIIVIVDYL